MSLIAEVADFSRKSINYNLSGLGLNKD
jgi:hypothetical protein